jgi:hypothetical protein
MLALDLSMAESSVNAVQQNSSLFVRLRIADLASDMVINSSLLDLATLRSNLLLTLGAIGANLNVLNGTTLQSLVLRSLRTEDQVLLIV